MISIQLLWMKTKNKIISLDIQGKLLELRSSFSFIEHEIIDNYEQNGTKEIDKIHTISSEKLTMGYGDFLLIEKGSFFIKSGDIVTVSGESGKGKSTLMKNIEGMIPNESIMINGISSSCIIRDILKSKILYLPQQLYILARIFVSDPDVIILDESISSIDNTGGYEIYNDIISHYGSKIIFIVSHNKEVFSLCNTLLSIEGNQLKQTCSRT